MNIVLLTATFFAFRYFGWPMECLLALIWCWWLLWLMPNTWRDFLAGMNYDRLKHGGTVNLPTDPEERFNEPDADWVVKWVLWLPGAAKNFLLAQIVCVLYFGRVPKPWIDVGVTKMLNRMEAQGGGIADRAQRVRKRWLSRYDRRGIHT